MMKKVLKWILIVLLALVLLAETGLLLTGNLYVNNVIAMTLLKGKTGPDIDELPFFPKHEVANATPEPWPVSREFGVKEVPQAIMARMETFDPVSFVVIRNDSLLYEKHWKGYGDSSYVNSFSMAKSITSLLIGCAIDDGLIGSINDPAGKYLASFRDGAKSKITIKHLLTMSSGLEFNEDYGSPFAWPAEAYYGPDVNALTLEAPAGKEPGKLWHYKGGDTQLLGMILKSVLGGRSIADYASEKIWKPVGAEHPAFWSTDRQDMEKVSCCFYTNARDYARIARLMLQHGRWNGKMLVDSAYVADALQPALYLEDIDDHTPVKKYGYQWWLMNYKDHPIFYMRGIRGQYVLAVPDLDLIVVRLGHKRGEKTPEDVTTDIYVYLDAAFYLAGRS